MDRKSILLSKYLEFSIRAGAYAASIFLSPAIDAYIKTGITNQYLATAALLGYSIVLFEIIYRAVNTWYQPVFLFPIDPVSKKIRIGLEKLIAQLGLYYLIQFLLNILLYNIHPLAGKEGMNMALGILGGILQIFNFLGAVIIGVALTNRLSKIHIISLVVIGMIFMLPLLIYVIYVATYFI